MITATFLHLYEVTCDVESHVLVPGGGAGQVTAVDSGILTPCSSDDEHGQCTVVRSVDAVSPVINRHVLAGRYTYRPRVCRAASRRSTGRLLFHPVDLTSTKLNKHPTY